jgi:hypothetical protein
VAAAVQLFVPLVLALIAVSVLLDFVIRNLLLVLLAAELFVIIAVAVILAAVMVETSTAAEAYHICIGCVTLAMLDHAMCINLLLLLLEFSPLTAAMLHQWLKKIQNTHNGQELVYISTCTPYTACQDHQLVVFLGLPVFHRYRVADVMKCLVVCHLVHMVLEVLHLIHAQTFVTTVNVADMVLLD